MVARTLPAALLAGGLCWLASVGLWAVHSTTHAMATDGYIATVSIAENTLTAANTDLLLASGVCSAAALHHTHAKAVVLSSVLWTAVVDLAGVFLLVQCCEYQHLYWGLASRLLVYRGHSGAVAG